MSLIKKISDITNYGIEKPFNDTLVEKGGAKLSRIMQHMRERNFVIISPYRGDNTEDENLELLGKMHHDVREMGLGMIQMKGYWVENKGTPDEMAVEERSLFIPNTTLPDEEFFEKMTNLAKKYKQEGFIYGDTKQVLLVDSVSGEKESIGDVKTIKTGDLGMAYSRIKGRDFAFESYIVPTNQASAMLMVKRGLFV
tara:strand:- start:1721 stop:2311 length:591 start_codon:yes stop_codon:yes gene_type:complete